jgi:hypothetical protein
MKMTKADMTFTVKHECGLCHGTGLYSGMGESIGAAIVCHSCKGYGFRMSEFTQFTGRKELPDVERVYQANPGIKIGTAMGLELDDFGGVPASDWEPGMLFPAGSEMRKFTCPQWWFQSAISMSLDWNTCNSNIGRSFPQCRNFAEKGLCWDRLDKEQQSTGEQHAKT